MVCTHPFLPAVTSLSAHGLPRVPTAVSALSLFGRPSPRTIALRSGLGRNSIISYVIAAATSGALSLPALHTTLPPSTSSHVSVFSKPHTSALFKRPSFAALPRAAVPAVPSLTTSRPMSSSSAAGKSGEAPSSSPSSSPSKKISFGPFDVTTQVFYETPLSFALVNLKPLLPGHVLVCPKKPHRRLTDLDADEMVDLFAAVQVVQRMLAVRYFDFGEAASASRDASDSLLHNGSFNIAVQDGPEAGQTVPHVHVHVLPRIRGMTAKDSATEGDALYEKMADEPGNVGGAQWDAAADEERQAGSRPKPGGRFPRIEDSSREARTMAAMEAEAAEFRQALASLGHGIGVSKSE